MNFFILLLCISLSNQTKTEEIKTEVYVEKKGTDNG